MKRINFSGTYTDLYQLTMAEVYFKEQLHRQEAVFDYFFRKLPFNSGYALFAGLYDVLEILATLKFTDREIDWLGKQGMDHGFINYLREFEFRGTVYSSAEGDVVFPVRPVLRVEGDLIETQVVETLLLNLLNFQTLIATKAARMRWSAGDRMLSEFGLRRAQGAGGYHAARAAVIGGFNSTSNVLSSIDHDLTAMGTMAHSFIQTHDDELEAFRNYARARPDQCLLLVDTYDTLRSGLPNAIKVGLELREKGYQLQGIRLDSGDLAYLSKQARKMLDEAGLTEVKIAASNQLDEHVIQSLLNQKAPIDIFGVGTSLATGAPDSALDGVYKLAYSAGKPRIKLSESLKKVTLPHRKQVFRVYDPSGLWLGADAVGLDSEGRVDHMYHPFEPDKSLSLAGLRQEAILQKVMENGRILIPKMTPARIADYSKERLALLPEEYKRFQNPHIYKIGLSRALLDLRTGLRSKHKAS